VVLDDRAPCLTATSHEEGRTPRPGVTPAVFVIVGPGRIRRCPGSARAFRAFAAPPASFWRSPPRLRLSLPLSFSFSSTRVARDKKNRRLLSALWAGCCVLAESLLFSLSRDAPSEGTGSRSASPSAPLLRVSRWRRRRAPPIAGGGRDVGGPGCLPAAEVPRQLRPGAQQGGAEDQRLER
jgi:hypothetical protein